MVSTFTRHVSPLSHPILGHVRPLVNRRVLTWLSVLGDLSAHFGMTSEYCSPVPVGVDNMNFSKPTGGVGCEGKCGRGDIWEGWNVGGECFHGDLVVYKEEQGIISISWGSARSLCGYCLLSAVCIMYDDMPRIQGILLGKVLCNGTSSYHKVAKDLMTGRSFPVYTDPRSGGLCFRLYFALVIEYHQSRRVYSICLPQCGVSGQQLYFML
ncbi:hypothetical protein P171DRAFT_215391 [Karstenula rhodostoma CBS 690.94]|uniref:Uncharacterized protein n=1 Tax=Karstenula rhodostoma CBS 690.94 TaxID=1392251 RepID=A0A9P4PTC9_9PLEO|nr:hypothetical protein P171DRAFT_215391 [Karstenula rhodostoma CBS 690.94]